MNVATVVLYKSLRIRRIVVPRGTKLRLTTMLAVSISCSVAFAESSVETLPQPPRVSVDTSYSPPRGRTLMVSEGADFQAALDAAKAGDVITLEAGAIFTGPFTLPAKAGAEWIVVRSSIADEYLPPPGRRIDPSYTDIMPKLTAKNAPVLVTESQAHHYRFIGIEIRPVATSGSYSHSLVQLGGGEKRNEQLPHHLIFDRCYLHGGEAGARRGIAMNSRHTAIIDSYLSDFKTVGEDAQAVAAWNGAGPFKITNNHLEAAGENVLFGGGDPTIPDLVQSDIEIRGNHFTKPLAWRIDAPSYAGTPWAVKNLFELKNARRVVFDGNLLEYNWNHAQNGFAVLFTVRNQNGDAPWSVVEDVTFANNVIRHVGGGINILGYDNNHPSRQTKRIHIRNNLFYDIGAPWGRGQFMQLLDGAANVVVERNTVIQDDNIVQAGEHRPHTGFVFIDNIVMHNAYGIIGGSTGIGQPSLKRYFPDAVVRGNSIVGGQVDVYPGDNYFPRSIGDLGFIDPARRDYRLKRAGRSGNSVARGANSGVDFQALCVALLGSPRAEKRFSVNPEDDTFDFCSIPDESGRK